MDDNDDECDEYDDGVGDFAMKLLMIGNYDGDDNDGNDGDVMNMMKNRDIKIIHD